MYFTLKCYRLPLTDSAIDDSLYRRLYFEVDIKYTIAAVRHMHNILILSVDSQSSSSPHIWQPLVASDYSAVFNDITYSRHIYRKGRSIVAGSCIQSYLCDMIAARFVGEYHQRIRLGSSEYYRS